MQTRRQFVAGAAAGGAALVLSPQAVALAKRRTPLFRGARFSSGVMSGDPSHDAITLWTRMHEAGGRGKVRLEVARDKSFRKVVARKSITTSEAVGHGVKARVTGLDPREEYFYRFETADRESGVGRFRTAPAPGSHDPVAFAFFSCQDYTHGWYNAHRLMAREDLDFVVCLGDYIYAETYHTRKGGTGVRDDRTGRAVDHHAHAATHGQEPLGITRIATKLGHYRDKYELYRSDKHLRAMHAAFPLVVMWDDHEVQNNYAGAEKDGGLPRAEGYTTARRRAGYRAFFENMPVYARKGTKLHRSLRFGNTVELLMLDQRQYRADQPCGDAVAEACADWDRDRAFLGRSQMGWLKNRLSASTADWKVIGNQVMCMPAKVLGDKYFTFDMWHGYPREREELLQHIRTKGVEDVVFVTGDIHTFIAGDVRTEMGKGETVALEFVGGSMTSTNLGEADIEVGAGEPLKGNDQNPNTPPAIIEALKGINPWVDAGDFDSHGYGVVKASRAGLDVSFRRLQTIKRKSTRTKPVGEFAWQVARGQKTIVS